MPKTYQPPHSLTPTMLRLSSKISEAVGRMSALEEEKNCGYAAQIAFAQFKVR